VGLFTGSLRRASCVLVGLAALSGLNTPYEMWWVVGVHIQG